MRGEEDGVRYKYTHDDSIIKPIKHCLKDRGEEGRRIGNMVEG
jgi:hypothetical protein